jgi:alpha-L-rhamnosidase
LKIERRDEGTYLVATGQDPQIIVPLKEAMTGKIIVKLRLQPQQRIDSKLYWKGDSDRFTPQRVVGRQLKPAQQVNDYLFSIDAKEPVFNLRFDPFETFDPYANPGEILIDSVSLFQQP